MQMNVNKGPSSVSVEFSVQVGPNDATKQERAKYEIRFVLEKQKELGLGSGVPPFSSHHANDSPVTDRIGPAV